MPPELAHQHIIFRQTFNAIDELLEQHQSLWRHQPFMQSNCPWRADYPDLFAALLQLSEEQVAYFESNTPQFIDWLIDFIPELAKALTALTSASFIQPTLSVADDESSAKFTHVGVPGRKWQQIKAFIRHLSKTQSDILDWCSGKGYLANELHYWSGNKVTCLELDKTLCDAGQKHAVINKMDIQFIKADVLETIPTQFKHPNLLHTGLHACGDLHISLLHQASRDHAAKIALSPCCYHKTKDDIYRPLSDTGKNTKLKLNRHDLHLATEEIVTGGQRVVRQRHTEQLWRLAFNFLYQEQHQTKQYLSLPSCPKSLLAKSFNDFCAWAIKIKSLEKIEQNALQPNTTERYLALGKTRLQKVSQLELIRKTFKQPLEHWLLLDRALFLCEQNYAVTLQEFCPKTVTPRNILIYAEHAYS